MNFKKNNLEKDEFYQSKYEYYKSLVLWIIVISSLAEVSYFISDCQLFDRFAYETLLPRCAILLPMTLFIIINKKCNKYKTMIPLAYFVVHCAMWCTIWSIYYLPIKTHASEGFIIMHLMFLAIGLCAPPKYSLFYHSMVMVNIILSYPFNRYENLDMMISLGLPCLIGIELLLIVMDKVYGEHYQIKKELELNVYTDQLTKIYNRKILSKITKEGTNSFVFDNGYIIILDIDYFKKVNDTYGHEIGDKMLISIADIISSCIGSNDYLLRWGGEEFVIITPNKSKKEVEDLAIMINKKIEDNENGICKITVSMGIAQYRKGDYHETIANADKALYKAKANGRNQFRFY